MNLHKEGKNIYELNNLVVVGFSYNNIDNIINVNYDYPFRSLTGENSPSRLIKQIREFKKQGFQIVCNDKLTKE